MSSGMRRVAAARSPAKQAPRSRSTSIISAVAPAVGSSGWEPERAAASSQPRSSRNTTAMGVAFDGAVAGASGSSRLRGVNRSHATSPSWHR
jgi:hypothetical protein